MTTCFRLCWFRWSLAVMVFTASGTAALAQTVDRFVGTVTIEGQPAIAVHVEMARRGEEVSGAVTIPGATYALSGRATDNGVVARITGQGVEGSLILNRTATGAVGTGELAGQHAVLALRETTAPAAEALGPPPQNLDLSTPQWIEDIDAFAMIIREQHGAPFHRIDRATFETAIADLKRRAPGLTGIQIATGLRLLSMMIGDGHTGVTLARSQPRFPVTVFWFPDGVRIVEASSRLQHLLGGRILAINGVPTAAVERRLRPHSPLGEGIWSFRGDLPALMVRAEILEAAGVAAAGPTIWTIRTVDNRNVSLTLVPEAYPVADRVRLGGQPPLWARKPAQPFQVESWPDVGTLYLNFRGYDDLAANSAALANRLEELKPRCLIIDMRGNGGGDYLQGRTHLLPVITSRSWINRSDRLFVLVGRNTFSAAMVNAADFDTTTAATLVGEPIGERPNSWQEPRRFYLPNSGLILNVSTTFYKFAANGAELIEPDVSAIPSWREWMAGRDVAISAVRRRCR